MNASVITRAISVSPHIYACPPSVPKTALAEPDLASLWASMNFANNFPLVDNIGEGCGYDSDESEREGSSVRLLLFPNYY